MAPVLNLNNEVSHTPPLGWRWEQAGWGRLGRGGPGRGSGRWRGPGQREGREAAELGGGVSPCERAGPGRTRVSPGPVEAVGKVPLRPRLPLSPCGLRGPPPTPRETRRTVLALSQRAL